MHAFRAVLLFVLTLAAASLSAQPQQRLPIIAGDEVINVLVEVDGTVKTWGDPWRLDMTPSLGNGVKPGPHTEVKMPTALAGVSGIANASVGPTQVLLLKRDGTVLAWGDNDRCEVGSKETKTTRSPVPVVGLRGVKQIATTEALSGAVLEDGSVWLWGTVERGQLGDGKFGARDDCTRTPTRVNGISGVKQLTLTGDTVLALKEDGTVWGWGGNRYGQLCNGGTEKQPTPAPIRGLSQVVSMENNSPLFVLADGTVMTCGVVPDGTMKTPQHYSPFRIPGVTNVRSIVNAGGAIMVHLADGTIRGWGNGYHGALGDGFGDRYDSKPHLVKTQGPVLAHYLSGGVSYAIRSDGTVLTWGQIIDPPHGPTEFYLVPTPFFTVQLGPRE